MALGEGPRALPDSVLPVVDNLLVNFQTIGDLRDLQPIFVEQAKDETSSRWQSLGDVLRQKPCRLSGHDLSLELPRVGQVLTNRHLPTPISPVCTLASEIHTGLPACRLPHKARQTHAPGPPQPQSGLGRRKQAQPGILADIVDGLLVAGLALSELMSGYGAHQAAEFCDQPILGASISLKRSLDLRRRFVDTWDHEG